MKRIRLINILVLCLLIIILIVFLNPFHFGEKAKKNELSFNLEEMRTNYLKDQGNAWGQRSDILEVLQKFQNAFVTKDSVKIDDFMSDLFVDNNQILILGTEPGEWYAGYEATRNLILKDWQKWGTLKMLVKDAYVIVNDNVAWFATIGRVGYGERNLPIRITGILVYSQEYWKISKLQFQWDVSINK